MKTIVGLFFIFLGFFFCLMGFEYANTTKYPLMSFALHLFLGFYSANIGLQALRKK